MSDEYIRLVADNKMSTEWAAEQLSMLETLWSELHSADQTHCMHDKSINCLLTMRFGACEAAKHVSTPRNANLMQYDWSLVA